MVLLDVRNKKEIAFGHFAGSRNPNTKSFSEWTARFGEAEVRASARVLMTVLN